MKFCAILLIFFLYGCANKNQPLTSAQRQPVQAPSSAFYARQYVEQDTQQQSRNEADILTGSQAGSQAGKNSNDLLNFQDAKLKCLSIGFKAGTEELGKCVLKFTK